MRQIPNIGIRARIPPGAPALGSSPPGSPLGRQRYVIALILTLTLVAVVLSFIFIWAFGPLEPKDTMDFFPIVAATLTGLVGAVVGFYFRSEERS
jgi:drug/metabolite transporter (DMT)-like permease